MRNRFLFPLLMAIVMMAMCPTKMWADDQEQGKNVIIYTATEKLAVVTNVGKGIHSDAFDITIISHEFSNGTGTITFSGDVTSIGTYAFYGCSGLRTISLPSSVKSIGVFSFFDCSSLTSIDIPDGIQEIGMGAFYLCSSLSSITIPSSVTTIGSMAFKDCYIAKNNVHNYSSVNLGGTFLTIVDKEQEDGVLITDNRVVRCRPNATDVTIPSDITYICQSAFANTNITSVTIPGGITIDGYAFYECSNLRNINIQGEVSFMGTSVFSGCYVTSSNLSVPSGLDLTEQWLTIVDTEQEDGLLITDDRVVRCRPNVTNVTIPDNVNSIDEKAFFYRDLTSITIPGNVKSIGDNAFSGCDGLASVTFLDGLESIGEFAFDNCYDLTSVTIPSTVKSIKKYAFNGCEIENVQFASIPQVGNSAFITTYRDEEDEESATSFTLALDDNSYVYTGEETNNIPSLTAKPTYTRTMKNQWGTIVLPFDVTIDSKNPYDFYEIASVNGDELSLSKMSGTLSAGTPALIRIYSDKVNGKTYELNITAADNNIDVSGDLTKSAGSLSLVGAYDYTDITAENGYIISNNAFWSIQDVKGENNVYCAPFRSYIAGTTSSSRLRIGDVDDESTGIAALDALNSFDAEYYDINGCKQNGLKNGVNIIKANGKTMKVIVR